VNLGKLKNIPLTHSLFCPHAGHWHLLFFRKKVNKKLSTAPFAINGSALISSSQPQMPRSNLSAFNGSALAGYTE